MNGLTSLLLSYLVNSLWQVPLIVAAAWMAARMLRAQGPAAEHRVWVAALVMEGVVPALSMVPWERMHFAWPWATHATAIAEGQVTATTGAGMVFEALRIPPALAALLVVAYLAAVVYGAIRFAWHFVRLSSLCRSAEPVVLNHDAARCWERWLVRFGAGRVVLASSAEIFAPVTMGIRQSRVLLPEGLIHRLSQADLDTAVAHELAHIVRKDFMKNLCYEVIFLPVSYHPGLWFTRQRVLETREMVCDEMAARVAGGRAYAESLLRLASLLLQGKPVRVPHAIGVFDSNTLERRIMKLTEIKKEIGRLRLCVSLGACVVLGIVTATSALALRLAVDQPGASNDQPSHKKLLTVPPGQMASLVLTKVIPKYPPAAKKARIQGTVELHAVIGKTGHVENLKLISGPDELQNSAMDAVRQWVYKPFLLNGDPVEVETTISVVYSLQK